MIAHDARFASLLPASIARRALLGLSLAIAFFSPLAGASQYYEVESIAAPTSAAALIYSPAYHALVLRNAASAVATVNLATHGTTSHLSIANFTDMSMSPSGRYVFAADYGGENIGYGTPLYPSHVHRVDLSDGTWEVKTAYIAGNVQAVSDTQLILKSIDQWVTFTNNLWGTGPAIVPVNASSPPWTPGYYASVFFGDFRYDAGRGRLLHGNSNLSSQEIQAFKLIGNDFQQQEGSGGYGSAQGFGVNVALATDASAFYYGRLQVDALDVTHNLRTFPEPIFAATGDVAFGNGNYYDAHTGALLGTLGFPTTVYGLNPGGTDFWAYDASTNRLRHFKPATVTQSAGSGQSTRVGTVFPQALAVLVKDSLGNPIPNVTVTWSVPASAASATFSGPSSTITDGSGLATIVASANAISGAYTVVAQVGGLSASFNLTNTITVSGGNACGANVATNTDLVEQYYAAILRRPSDAGGKAYWLSEADRLCGLGADPKQTFFLLANAFYNSPEYFAFNRDNAGFVTDMYITFFGRLPDAGGQSYWLGQLTAGMTRNNVMASFLFSPEFTATMNRVFPGRTARAETYLTLNLYGGYLRRLADSAGYNYWDGQFRLAQCLANPAGAVTATIDAVSSQFQASAEYAARATTNSQFVDDLYYAMLQRGGDLAGFNYWVSQLNAGVARDQLRQQFLTSPEMQGQSAAIAAQGCLP
jgi:hypothetical protein